MVFTAKQKQVQKCKKHPGKSKAIGGAVINKCMGFIYIFSRRLTGSTAAKMHCLVCKKNFLFSVNLLTALPQMKPLQMKCDAHLVHVMSKFLSPLFFVWYFFACVKLNESNLSPS